MNARDPAAQMVEALLQIGAAVLTPINEAVDGYRADLERRGYSPTAAETMSMEYHRLLFAHLLQNARPS